MKHSKTTITARSGASLVSLYAGLMLVMALSLVSPQTASGAGVIKASTSMTIVTVSNYKNVREPGDAPIDGFPVKAKISNVNITSSSISWNIEDGLYGLLYAFYTENGGKTYTGWGWDYVTPGHRSKHLEGGYPRGWVGTAIATCALCKGHAGRTNLYFVNN